MDGKVSDERFMKMTAAYEAEQNDLKNRVAELQTFIDKSKEKVLNIEAFLRLVRRYSDIRVLDAEIIRSFVERIEVFQPEKVPGTKTKKQTIRIFWNHIGILDIPEMQKETA